MSVSDTLEAPVAVSAPAQRLAALRAELRRQGLDGFVFSRDDEHLNEFPPAYARRLKWATGFGGSTAWAVALADTAAIFVPSLYAELVKAHVDPALWSHHIIPQTMIGGWLAQNAPRNVSGGARIGYDARTYSRGAVQAIAQLAGPGITLVPVEANPIDQIWTDQPEKPNTPMFVHPIERAGQNSADKRRQVGEWLTSVGADACVLTALDSIAWLFNTRGRDVDITPVTFAFSIVRQDGTADLFVEESKLDESVRQHLGNSVRVRPYEQFPTALGEFEGKTVSVDPMRSPVAIQQALEAGGAKVRDDRDPVSGLKIIKNAVEIEGVRQAHIRDGGALTRFLHWFSVEAPKGGVTELSAAVKLNSLRAETPLFHSLSFDPVSGVDAHGALPHYWVTEETDAPIGPDSLYLTDSGGQYPDGTTDVTRTVIVGTPTDEMRDRFTRVLKGHIALDTVVFPAGTMGFQLDSFARHSLWQAGLDYCHGTGHGVGAFLHVHEGPVQFAGDVRANEPFQAGMVVSNEPAYYKVDHYGIRIENLMVSVERDIPGAEQPMLGFEAVTMAPLDPRLIDVALLTDAELEWINDYHAKVLKLVGPLVPADTRAWLEAECAPLAR
jgi:Xaa-Pro aminopeptidase